MMSQTSKTISHYRSCKSSPLLNSNQSEYWGVIFKRIHHKYRFYIGACILTILRTSVIVYFLNYGKSNPINPN